MTMSHFVAKEMQLGVAGCEKGFSLLFCKLPLLLWLSQLFGQHFSFSADQAVKYS